MHQANPHRPVLTIDLDAVSRNYALLKTRVGPNVNVAAMVKADAYGLGVDKIAPVLSNEGCKLFFVATLEEGIYLRKILPSADIAVLNGYDKKIHHDIAGANLIPVINTLDQLKQLTNNPLPHIWHIDTGMNRLGLPLDDLDTAIATGMIPRLAMTHFACADDHAHPMNARQTEIAKSIQARLRGVPLSLANSSGIFLGPQTWFDTVRPGMALYGLNPLAGQPNPMTPVVALTTPILQIRNAKPGDTVGYGASHTIDRPTRLATLPLGYADGFLRAAGKKRHVHTMDGRACHVIGRVSMDLAVADIGDAPLNPGDLLSVIGPYQTADDLAESVSTIGYEILTALRHRAVRDYRITGK